MSARTAPVRTRTGGARERAAEALVRVESDDGYAAAVLDASCERTPALAPVDRGLLTQLVYGVLRSAPALDARLQRHATRAGSIAKLDVYARTVLRLAAYQIVALERVPVHAAVNAAVESLKRDRSPGLASFANALLRKLATERREGETEAAREELAMQSVPGTIVNEIADVVGGEPEARRVLRAMLGSTPVSCVRVDPERVGREALAAALREERPNAVIESGSLSPWALRVSGGGDLRATRAWREGRFTLQEEGAQCVALMADVREGQSVLDVCAGRGGKTGMLAGMLRGRGTLHAAELYPEKVRQLDEEMTRLGVRASGLAFASAAVDVTRGWGALERARPAGGYDAVLLDAPCSGLGTLGRRPEIALRWAKRAASEREGVRELQARLLDTVATRVRVGGVLVYAVCALAAGEGVEQAAAFRARHPGWVLAEGSAEVPERLRVATVMLRPDRDGTDGFVMVRMRRESA